MAKRFTASNVNWTLVMETLPHHVSQRVAPLKIAYDKYLREIALHPAELPKIDWALYKNRITAPGMVDSFMKAYEGLKIPYPSDQGGLADAEKLNAQILKTVDENIKSMSEEIKQLQEKLKNLNAVMKFSEMTIEEMLLARPELRFDPDKPKLAPVFIPDPPSPPKEEEDDH